MQAVSFCLLHKLHILLQMGNCCSIILNAFQKFAGKKQCYLLRVASDISAGKGFTSRALLGCFALAGASHSTLEHAPLHHLTLDIVQPDQKLQFNLSRASKVCHESPGEIWVEVLPVNHVQGWVELVCSNCDTARGWDKPMNVFYKNLQYQISLAY